MIHAYRTHQPTIDLFPDAERALARLAGCYQLGLITDGPRVVQRAKVDALRLDDHFAEIIFTDELGEGRAKPHPAAYELMTQRLGVAPKHCAYVGDNLSKDFLSPNRLGWRTIYVDRGDGVHYHKPAPPDGAPQHTINSLDELDALIA